mmetsp:Transcript_34648/g.83686  ORF Transcript_34648/g.83686 Transcript_34648/m.83686 type:complete len:442 (-) Transcript_34648:52-1377(-)
MGAEQSAPAPVRHALSDAEAQAVAKSIGITPSAGAVVSARDLLKLVGPGLRAFVPAIFIGLVCAGKDDEASHPTRGELEVPLGDFLAGVGAVCHEPRQLAVRCLLEALSDTDAGVSEHAITSFLIMLLQMKFCGVEDGPVPDFCLMRELLGLEGFPVAAPVASAAVVEHLPDAGDVFVSWLGHLLLGQPSPAMVDVTCSRIAAPEGLLPLVLRRPEFMQFAWKPLYLDWRDGRSFFRLTQGVLHYPGPTLVLCRSGENCFGAVVGCAWEETGAKYRGSGDFLLFQLSPKFKELHTSGRGGNLMYFNTKMSHMPSGLGFGGQQGAARLWIPADFQEAHSVCSDATFEKGCLVGDSHDFMVRFSVDVLEVWGAGGAEADQAQGQRMQVDASTRQSARKVDRARLIENSFDKEMLFEKTFKSADGSRHVHEDDEGLTGASRSVG